MFDHFLNAVMKLVYIVFFKLKAIQINERLNEMEFKFQQAISKVVLENEDQNEEIKVLNAARKSKTQRLHVLEGEVNELKAENLNQTIRIRSLEKFIEDHAQIFEAKKPKQPTNLATSSPDNVGASLPTSCNDLSSYGNDVNGIYLTYDPKVKKIATTFCKFSSDGIGIF